MGGRTWGEACGQMLDPEGRCGGWRRAQGGISPACTKPPGAGAGVGEDECFACAQSSLTSARWLPGCWVHGHGQARQDRCAAQWALMWRAAGSRTRAGLGLGQGLQGKKQADGKLSWRSCCGRLWAESRRVGRPQQKGREGEGLSNSRRGRAPVASVRQPVCLELGAPEAAWTQERQNFPRDGVRKASWTEFKNTGE